MKKKIEFQEIEEHIATKYKIWIEGNRLVIDTLIYEKEDNGDWWESMGSTTSLPIEKIQELLAPKRREK